jgi:hypothetical protein
MLHQQVHLPPRMKSRSNQSQLHWWMNIKIPVDFQGTQRSIGDCWDQAPLRDMASSLRRGILSPGNSELVVGN